MSQDVARSLLFTVTLIAATSFASPARACDCGFASWSLPDHASQDVPSNTRIWLDPRSFYDCDAPSLGADGGTAVAVTKSRVTRAGTRFDEVIVLTPEHDLEVGATYTLTGCPMNLVDGAVSFRVTSGPDTTAPAIPGLELGEPETGEETSCGAPEYWTATLRRDTRLVLLDIAGRASWDAATSSGAAVAVFYSATGAPGAMPVSIGSGSCTSNWSFEQDGDATAVRVGAVDLAGNFSGWSAPQSVEAPGCGCDVPGRSAGRSAASLAAVALGAAITLARRRARRA